MCLFWQNKMLYSLTVCLFWSVAWFKNFNILDFWKSLVFITKQLELNDKIVIILIMEGTPAHLPIQYLLVLFSHQVINLIRISKLYKIMIKFSRQYIKSTQPIDPICMWSHVILSWLQCVMHRVVWPTELKDRLTVHIWQIRI